MKKPTVNTAKARSAASGSSRTSCRRWDRLVLREENVKVTLSLSQRSVTFCKRAALKRRVPYQRMIRALVDACGEAGREGVTEQRFAER